MQMCVHCHTPHTYSPIFLAIEYRHWHKCLLANSMTSIFCPTRHPIPLFCLQFLHRMRQKTRRLRVLSTLLFFLLHSIFATGQILAIPPHELLAAVAAVGHSASHFHSHHSNVSVPHEWPLWIVVFFLFPQFSNNFGGNFSNPFFYPQNATIQIHDNTKITLERKSFWYFNVSCNNNFHCKKYCCQQKCQNIRHQKETIKGVMFSKQQNLL